jgi:hypothetical protein
MPDLQTLAKIIEESTTFTAAEAAEAAAHLLHLQAHPEGNCLAAWMLEN